MGLTTLKKMTGSLTDRDHRLLAVLEARPDSIESFDEVYPMDVGLKLPVEHAHGSTYGFFFDCFADVIIDIGYERTFARTAVVYDFKKGQILDVTPDVPELAVTGRWTFSPYGSRTIKECWKEPGDEFFRTGVIVYSWKGNQSTVSSNDDDGLTSVFTHDEVENLGFLIMRKLSVVAEK